MNLQFWCDFDSATRCGFPASLLQIIVLVPRIFVGAVLINTIITGVISLFILEKRHRGEINQLKERKALLTRQVENQMK